MVWLDTIINVVWPIITAVAPIIFGVGLLWLRSQFPTRSDFEGLISRVGQMASDAALDRQRLNQLARDSEGSPTRLELLEKMSSLASEMAQVQATNKAIQRQLTTQNDYLHTLIEKGLK